MKLLHIDSSILGPNSVSRTLTAEIVESERARHLDLQVTYRDLAATPLQHISGTHLAAAQPNQPAPSTTLQDDLAQGQAALEEFLAADTIVIGAPMYNFGIPSQLKSWIDRIAVAGKTFKYGPTGPEGLATGKKVIIASSRGGLYSPHHPTHASDHQETYLRSVFQFLGITDITFIRAEGLAMATHRTQSLADARTAIATLS